MTREFIEVDLNNDEKEAILKYASFFVLNETTKSDLENSGKKWIRFSLYDLTSIIGELSYYFNRSKSDQQFYFLNQLIGQLEYYEQNSMHNK